MLTGEELEASIPAVRGVLRGKFKFFDFEDVLQDTMLNAWKFREKYDDSKGTPVQWLCTIARNVVTSRSRRGDVFYKNRVEFIDPSGNNLLLDQVVEPRAEHIRFLKEISNMPHGHLLLYTMDTTLLESAAAFGLPKTTIHRRIDKLRKKLARGAR